MLNCVGTLEGGNPSLSPRQPRTEKECLPRSYSFVGTTPNGKLWSLALPSPRIPHWVHFYDKEKE